MINWGAAPSPALAGSSWAAVAAQLLFRVGSPPKSKEQALRVSVVVLLCYRLDLQPNSSRCRTITFALQHRAQIKTTAAILDWAHSSPKCDSRFYVVE